jgi:hypothetical protein
MAEQDMPDRKSRMEKAEGDREIVAANLRDDRDEGGGITNRPLDEERENQERLPDRGESKPGAHAGGTSERAREKGHDRDPVMPKNDETLRTDI